MEVPNGSLSAQAKLDLADAEQAGLLREPLVAYLDELGAVDEVVGFAEGGVLFLFEPLAVAGASLLGGELGDFGLQLGGVLVDLVRECVQGG